MHVHCTYHQLVLAAVGSLTVLQTAGRNTIAHTCRNHLLAIMHSNSLEWSRSSHSSMHASLQADYGTAIQHAHTLSAHSTVYTPAQISGWAYASTKSGVAAVSAADNIHRRWYIRTSKCSPCCYTSYKVQIWFRCLHTRLQPTRQHQVQLCCSC